MHQSAIASATREIEEHLSLDTLSSLEEARGLEDAWKALLPPDAPPFSTFEWNLAWLEAFFESFDEPAISILRRDGAPEAIVPLYRTGNQLRMVGDLTCDYQDIVARDPAMAGYALRRVTERARRPRMRLDFEKVAEGSLVHGALETRQPDNGFHRHDRLLGPAPWLPLRGDWDEFLKGLTKKRRADIKRLENRINRELPANRTHFLEGKEITRDVLRRIGDVHRRNQFRKKGSSMFADSRFVEVLERTVQAPDVGAHVSLLENGEDLMAFVLGFCRGGCFYYWVIAYESSHARYSPGTVLTSRLFRHLLENRRASTFDFLCGAEPYKYLWTKQERNIFTITLLPRSPAGFLRKSLLQTEDFLKPRVKAILIRTGLYKPAYRT